MLLPFLGFLAFFLVDAVFTRRVLRLSEEELQQRLSDGYARVGFAIHVARAPIAGLVFTFLMALLAFLVLLWDYTDSRVVVALVCVTLVSAVLSLLVAFVAICYGRPAFLVHPRLRGDNDGRAD